MTTGRPIWSTTSRARSMAAVTLAAFGSRFSSGGGAAVPEAGTDRPMPIIASLKRSRSSAVAMASALAPISSGVPGTPTRPASKRSMARLRAVWPPRVARTASGCSWRMISARTSTSRGSM